MIDPKTLFPALMRYREPDPARALFELGVTLSRWSCFGF